MLSANYKILKMMLMRNLFFSFFFRDPPKRGGLLTSFISTYICHLFLFSLMKNLVLFVCFLLIFGSDAKQEKIYVHTDKRVINSNIISVTITIGPMSSGVTSAIRSALS